jgi:leader peptidase (prepilin peptidase)/N-methyltransferase
MEIWEIIQASPFAIYPMAFLLGSVFGSFYFNLSFRVLELFYTQERKKYKGLARWKRLLFHPSNCENCNHPISSIGLIPILGYFLTKRQCSRCGYSIPIIYPLGELFFGLLPVLVIFLTGNPVISLLFVLLTGHLVISISTDARFFSLDYENLIWILGWGILLHWNLTGSFFGLDELFVLLGFGGFFLILYLFYPKGIGFGDVLFAPFFALLAGHPWWIFFLNASYIPAVIITLLMRKKGESIRSTPIPMGVYFCIGLFLTYIAKLVFIKFGMEIEPYE